MSGTDSVRYPAMVTIDTGAVLLKDTAMVGASCEHPEHSTLLMIQSRNEIVSVAGTERELQDFAVSILTALTNYQLQREGVN